MKFGPHVKQVREHSGIGLRELARLIELSPTYVSRVETGKLDYVTEETILKWAQVLGQDPDYLLALAGRLPSDLIEQAQKHPDVYSALIRNLRGMKAASIGRVAEQARIVKEGKW